MKDTIVCPHCNAEITGLQRMLVSSIINAKRGTATKAQCPTCGRIITRNDLLGDADTQKADKIQITAQAATSSASGQSIPSAFGVYNYKYITFRNHIAPAFFALAMFGVFVSTITTSGVNGTSIVTLVLFIVATGVTVFGFRESQDHKGSKIELTKDGIVRTKGDTSTFTPWSSIKEVELTYPNEQLIENRPLTYTIILDNGERFRIDYSVNNYQRLGNGVLREACNYRLPLEIERLGQGQKFVSGNLVVDQDGLSDDKGKISWHETKEVTTRILAGTTKQLVATRKDGSGPFVSSFPFASAALSAHLVEGFIAHFL